MATQLKDKSAGKNDTFIEAQLARAQNRIRFLDLLTALLGFLAGTLGFAVLMILLDRRWELSAGVRQGALVVYLAGAAVYLLFTVVRPLTWRVNPYFAARRLEETLPGSRNHVINWIDLHGEKVPSVLKSALGQRAAKDLAKTDVDNAISTRRALSAGGTAGLLFVMFIALFFLFGPRPFASLFGRLFAPFGLNGRIASRTEVDVVRPRSTTVTIGNAVTIVALVGGRVPDARADDAPCLLYRHDESEPYRKRFLQADDSNQEWATTISPIDVGDGFSYKVAAGDAATEEFHIGVRAAPLISEFKATYHYRPYTGKAAQTRTSRKLEDLRGTEVEINALTNRTIKDGRLEFDGDDGVGAVLRSEPVANEPQQLRFRIVLDRAGKYRIRFTSTDGEAYIDSTAHEIAVFPDHPPQVRLIEPGKDVVLPANGQLELKGEASDDFGIGSLTLQMHIVGGLRLQSKPYLADKLGKPNYGTPRNLDYRELLVLSTLKTHDGKPAELTPGMEIEYWLEAADACDYPRPNVTSSQPHYKIKIAPADKDDARRQKEREQANARQKEHEKQESDRIKKEQEARDEQKRKDEAAEKEKSRAEEKNGNDKKDGGKGKESGEKKPGEKSEPKEGGNADEKKDNDTQAKADELKNRLDQKEQKGDNKSEKGKRGEARGSGEDKKPGQGKDQGEKKPGQAEGKDNKPGESRGDGGQGQKNPAGEKKEGGKPGEQGSARGEDKPDPSGQKGEAKKPGEKGAEGRPQPGQGKEASKPKSSPGEAKDQGKGDPSKTAGEPKPEDKSKPGDPKRQGEAKGKGTPGKPSDGNPGETKPGERKEGTKPPSDAPKGECKECNGNGGKGKSGASAKGSKEAGKDKPSGLNADGREKAGEKKEDGNEAGKGKPSGLNGDGSKPGEKKVDGKGRDKQSAGKQRNDTPAGQDKPAGEGEVKKGEKKEGDGKEGHGEGKGSDAKEPAEKGNSKGPPKEGEAPGKGKDRGRAPGGPTGEREAGTGSGDGDDPEARREKPEAHRASMLQLEEFRKKVDKDILKDMKMSKEDFDRFLKDYAELAKRQTKAAAEAPEAVAPPRVGGTLPTIAGGPRKTTGSGKTDDLKSDGRAQPPPGYRDPYADFVRRLNMPKK
jgi:collagen type III alpha